jgi:hypothetical protein
MQQCGKSRILPFLACLAFCNESAHALVRANPNFEKNEGLAMTRYSKIWDYFQSDLVPSGNFQHLTQQIQWSLNQPGSYFWDYCFLFAPSDYYYGWIDARWDEQGNGMSYGPGIAGRGDCGGRDYSSPQPITGYRPPTPSRMCHGGSFRVTTDQYGIDYQEIVNREEKVTYELRTGAKGYPGRQNLFVLSAGATAHSDLFYPEWDQNTGSYVINPTTIQIGDLGSPSSDGLLCVALENNTTRDATPRAPSRYYDCAVSAGKYLLLSQVSCIPPGNTNLDRTTLGVGENVSVYFNPQPPVGVVWTATAGSLAGGGNLVVLTAPGAAGDATVTATVRSAKLSIDFSVLEPTGFDHADITSTFSYGVGVSGAGMHLNVYLAPTTVSFNAVQILEVGQPASDISGYFTQPGHAPLGHGSAQGANVWQPVQCDNQIGNGFDNAAYSGMPGPWTPGGGFKWHIPVLWKVGSGSSHSLTSWDQVFSLQPDGTFTVSKFGHSVTRTINDAITTQ